jgi:tetratricopeptide (TPR) repeat protein
VRAKLGDDVARAELAKEGSATAAASPPPPASRIATTEAPPVAAPTSPADAVEKAKALRNLDFYEDAVRVLKDADARYGETAPVRLETAWNLLMIAEEDVTRDADPKKIEAEVVVARQAFEQALKMDPKVADQDVLHAKLLRYEGASVQARVLLRGLVELSPDDPAAHREYADFAYTAGDWLTAEREYTALSKLQPKDGWPILYATISAQWLERPAAELETGYLQAARMLPEEPMPLVHLSALYADQPERNAGLLEQVIAERPQSVMARVALARLVAAPPIADRDRAGKILDEALTISRRSEHAQAGLAALLESEGKTAEALRRWLDALVVADAMTLADASQGTDRVLRSAPPAAIPADLRKRAWELLIDRHPASGRFAHDAGVWYLDVAHEREIALHYLELAVAREPSEAAYASDLARVRAAAR